MAEPDARAFVESVSARSSPRRRTYNMKPLALTFLLIGTAALHAEERQSNKQIQAGAAAEFEGMVIRVELADALDASENLMRASVRVLKVKRGRKSLKPFLEKGEIALYYPEAKEGFKGGCPSPIHIEPGMKAVFFPSFREVKPGMKVLFAYHEAQARPIR